MLSALVSGTLALSWEQGGRPPGQPRPDRGPTPGVPVPASLAASTRRQCRLGSPSARQIHMLFPSD